MLRENHFNYVEAVAQQEVTKAELEQCKARLRAMTHDLGLTDADMEAAIEAALAIPPEVQSGGSN
jgi:hypothetical protein